MSARDEQVAHDFVVIGISLYRPSIDRDRLLSGVEGIFELYARGLSVFPSAEDARDNERAVFYIAHGIAHGAEMAGDYVTAQMIKDKIERTFRKNS